MLPVSTNASWLPSSTGSRLGKRARTEPDCSGGGGRVRKRSQEQHPRDMLCLPCMDWLDAPGPCMNRYNVHARRASSSVPGLGGHIAFAHQCPSSCHPALAMHPSTGTQWHSRAPATWCWRLYLARTPPRRASRDGASQPAFISSQLAEETTSPRLCCSPRGCTEWRHTPSARLCWEPRKW